LEELFKLAELEKKERSSVRKLEFVQRLQEIISEMPDEDECECEEEEEGRRSRNRKPKTSNTKHPEQGCFVLKLSSVEPNETFSNVRRHDIIKKI